MAVSVKVDEDLPADIARLRGATGYDATTVYLQGHSGLPDQDLWPESTNKSPREVERAEQECSARGAVDEHLLAAIASGESTPMTEKDWNRIRTEGLRLAQNRRTN
jgi:hypothetical protein